MKLKTAPPIIVSAAASLPLAKPLAFPPRYTVTPAFLSQVQQPFESFVRSMVATKKTTPLPPLSSAPAAEEVIAQTEVDGMQYVILRRGPSSRETNINLSPREREIICLIAKGFPNKAIADALEISTWTVGTHLRRIFAKMGVTSRAAMVAKHFRLAAILSPSSRTRPPLENESL